MTASSDGLTVAIVGATGAVGQEFLDLIDQRRFPYARLKALASPRSAGKTVRCGEQAMTVEALDASAFDGVDLALFSAGGSISREYAPIAADRGAVVVDNSSAFRMAQGVPLVIPEINPQAVEAAGVALGSGGIIANPNCSTIIMLMAVTPIHRRAGVGRIVASTYQAASGAGAAAMAELEAQTRASLAGDAPETWPMSVMGLPYAFNLFSHNSEIGPDGYNVEETKMIRETHKVWADSAVRITATCIRVPVMRAHAESINLTLNSPLSPDAARDLLREAPGVEVVDDRDGNRFPTPLDASGRDPVLVGRVRADQSQDPGMGLDLFCCGDQIRKGAALNALQIAEMLIGQPAGA